MSRQPVRQAGSQCVGWGQGQGQALAPLALPASALHTALVDLPTVTHTCCLPAHPCPSACPPTAPASLAALPCTCSIQYRQYRTQKDKSRSVLDLEQQAQFKQQ